MIRTTFLCGLAVAAAIAFWPHRGSGTDCGIPDRLMERLVAETGTSTAVEMCIVAATPFAYIIPCGVNGAFDDELFEKVR